MTFFSTQIKPDAEGLWCVSLLPNGQIQELIELKTESKSDLTISLRSLRTFLRSPKTAQWLGVIWGAQTAFMMEEDWLVFEMLKRVSEEEEVPLCDFLKCGGGKMTSVLSLNQKFFDNS